MPADRTKRSAVQPESGVCLPYQALFRTGYHGYCEDIIGYLPVYGSNKNELYENEMKMYRYRAMKTFLEQTRQNSTDNSYVVRQSCLDMVDYVYCHHYFKRCYISSSPQFVCREACDNLYYKACDREFKMVMDFLNSQGPYPFDIINCTTLSFRNESSNCYYPDEIRGQCKGLLVSLPNLFFFARKEEIWERDNPTHLMRRGEAHNPLCINERRRQRLVTKQEGVVFLARRVRAWLN